jgi:16S rRNA (cytosine967-C5)-methyltransferase
MRRVRLLASTLRRCGVASARVVQVGKSGPLPFAESSFDRLLVDAPCSGLGTVRRDPDIKWKRSPADLPGFAAIQTDLLQRLSRLLRPGGRLVYSTCSSEPEENEEVVGSFLTSARDFVRRPLSTLVEVPATIRALGDDTGVLQTSPQLHGLEAFFGAVLERQG